MSMVVEVRVVTFCHTLKCFPPLNNNEEGYAPSISVSNVTPPRVMKYIILGHDKKFPYIILKYQLPLECLNMSGL